MCPLSTIHCQKPTKKCNSTTNTGYVPIPVLFNVITILIVNKSMYPTIKFGYISEYSTLNTDNSHSSSCFKQCFIKRTKVGTNDLRNLLICFSVTVLRQHHYNGFGGKAHMLSKDLQDIFSKRHCNSVEAIFFEALFHVIRFVLHIYFGLRENFLICLQS